MFASTMMLEIIIMVWAVQAAVSNEKNTKTQQNQKQVTKRRDLLKYYTVNTLLITLLYIEYMHIFYRNNINKTI